MTADPYADLEFKLKAVKECRQMELALAHCKAGIINQGIVYKIAAETDYGTQMGGAERSVDCPFTIEESARLFQLADEMLTARLASTRAKLGV
jgi:hypothetical protein